MKHYITDLTEIDGAGGTDDYVGDAGLMEFDFHIEIDSFGSHEEYTK